MKKAIILCCMVVFTGCGGSNQRDNQDVLQLVQVNKLETKNRQLEATVEAQKAEIEQLRAERTNQEASHSQLTTELKSQISQLQATVEAQKVEIEQLKKAKQRIDTGQTATPDT
jgi:predicted RNase H-like nuclease (RuvC/YqgF family)